MPVATALRAFLADFDADARWLVACSGGQDSVVLAHVCKAVGVAFDLAHVNYHLRGAESDADEAFVQALAEQLGVVCHTYAAILDKDHAVQEQARDVRYAFFADMCSRGRYAGTLVAHHAQDQAETILHNLLRGTGLNGLAGMRLWQPERLIGRPLLPVAKETVIAYARAYSIAWREDASNSTDHYTRNRLRNNLLPMLDLLEPNWQKNLLKTASQASEVWAEYQHESDAATQWPTTLTFEPTALRMERAAAIQSHYKGLHLSMAIRLAEATLQPTSAERKLETAFGTFEVSDTALYFSANLAPSMGSQKVKALPPQTLSLTPRTAPTTLEALKEEAATGIYYLAEEACPPPYVLRPPQVGDRMQPLGMVGTRLISDIRADKGVPATALRDVRLLVRADGVILWCSLGIVAEGAKCAPGQPALQIMCR